jgi:hypothetical protein
MDTSQLSPSLVCSSCGTTPAPEDEPTARLTWSRSTEHGHATWMCERCSREQVRDIESKLDPVWR